tara:strand:+ start:326 stop:889 length:564 start_codon:yes stop_codon:yes gene_type:complete
MTYTLEDSPYVKGFKMQTVKSLLISVFLIILSTSKAVGEAVDNNEPHEDNSDALNTVPTKYEENGDLEEKFKLSIDKLQNNDVSEKIRTAAIQLQISRNNAIKAKQNLVDSGLSYIPSDEEKKYANAIKREEEMVDELVNAASQLPPEYSQPAFQCLSDYDLCVADNNMIVTCGVYLAICLADNLLP